MRTPPRVGLGAVARQRRRSNRIALPSGMLSPWECAPVAPIPGRFAGEHGVVRLAARQSEAQWRSWHGLSVDGGNYIAWPLFLFWRICAQDGKNRAHTVGAVQLAARIMMGKKTNMRRKKPARPGLS